MASKEQAEGNVLRASSTASQPSGSAFMLSLPQWVPRHGGSTAHHMQLFCLLLLNVSSVLHCPVLHSVRIQKGVLPGGPLRGGGGQGTKPW